MYSIAKTPDYTMLMAEVKSINRFQFKHEVDGEWVPVKLTRAGGYVFGKVSGAVKVFSKPHPSTYHHEMIRQNARAMWMGVQAEPDRLLDNMLEYVEILE